MSIVLLDAKLLATESTPWEKWYELMVDFREKNGCCLVPYFYMTEDGYDLYRWVLKQRYDWTFGEISDERIRLLDELNFIWEQQDHAWEKGIAALMRYKAEYGDCVVDKEYKVRDFYKPEEIEYYELGEWVAAQRIFDGNFPREKYQRLKDLGFIWSLREYNWLRAYEALKEYKEVNGDCSVPTEFMTEDGMELGLWVQEQRVNLHYKYLTEERMVKLDELGFAWAMADDSSPVVFVDRRKKGGEPKRA